MIINEVETQARARSVCDRTSNHKHEMQSSSEWTQIEYFNDILQYASNTRNSSILLSQKKKKNKKRKLIRHH